MHSVIAAKAGMMVGDGSSFTNLTAERPQHFQPISRVAVAIRAVMHAVAACPGLMRIPARLHPCALAERKTDESNEHRQGKKRYKPIRHGRSPIIDHAAHATLLRREQNVAERSPDRNAARRG